MRIDIITIFPQQVEVFVEEGIFRRASLCGVVIKVHDLRRWAKDKHRSVDDTPFGGGPGMVLMVEPIYKAVKELSSADSWVILTGAKGSLFTSQKSKQLAKKEHLIIICGHYEGVDERVKLHIANEEISIGKYVLSGGELPALVISDAVLRNVSGVLGNPLSLKEESYESDIMTEYPQYTRPADFRGWKVPEVLMSGDHQTIAKWRKARCNR